MSKPLILVDASSYFFRAFHALPPLTNSKGQPTGAVYGVVNMIKRLIKDYQPEQIAIVFDAKGKTFRDDWYPEYKATRQAMPSDLSCQFEPLLKLLHAMGLPLLIIDGVEADDVIGTLAVQASQQQHEVIISTGDKDFAQLVNEHITLINTMSNQTLNPTGVKEKFGVTPTQMIDYLTLIGDSVDNIPGISKCGPKTAVKWLEQYQTLDNLIENADTIGGKIGECLRDGMAQLPLSKRLITIKTDVELPLSFNELQPRTPDKTELIELVRELEFKTWLKELLQEEPDTEQEGTAKPMVLQYTLVDSPFLLSSLLEKVSTSQMLSLIVKGTHSESMQAELVGIALAFADNEAFYIPLLSSVEPKHVNNDEVLALLKPFLENPSIAKMGYDLKYDYNVLKNAGITMQGIHFDVMLASYVLNSTATRHDLETLALKYLGQKPTIYEDIAGKGAKQLRFDAIPLAQAGAFAAEQALLCLQLEQVLHAQLDERLQSVLNTIEMPLLSVLADIENTGVLIDCVTLGKHGERLKVRIQALEEEALQLAQRPFNLNSPKQLQEILFEELKLPVHSRTPTGQASTAESVLQELAYDYRLPALILEYRGLSKLVSTYIDALPKCVNKRSQRVHTSYNQAVAATGRLSSSDPNLQNIPIRSEEGRLIRTAFIAAPHHVLLAADYSQIELRIMAHLSHDANLLKAFANNWDIHTATASEIFQVPLDEVSAEQRRRAKAVNFGLIYGMSAFGLSKQLGIERQDAQLYMDLYFQRYPGVREYMDRTRKLAHQQGYVETVFGRRLHLPEINIRNIMRQKAAERMAINAPMQGSAADIIKKAMIAMAKWQQALPEPYARMIMQVHDELVFEVREDKINEVSADIRQLMENTVQLSVPLQVSIGVGKNWDEAH